MELQVEQTDIRIDQYLAQELDISRSKIQKLMKQEKITVNGKKVNSSYLVKIGDMIVVDDNLDFSITVDKENIPLDIVYEDDYLLVVNKKSGMVVHPAPGNYHGTLVNALLYRFSLSNSESIRPGIVHRIDKDTSGVLVVAKNERIRDALQDHWNDIVKFRGYYAIVEGNMEEKKKTIKSWLREASTNLMYSSRKPGDGKESITHYQVIKEIDGYSLLDVNIDTGRKNQIRVHMKDIGHNIIGDERYGSTKNPLNRLGLHAYALEFIHPITKKVMRFETPMPNEFVSMFGVKQKQLKKIKA